MNIGVIEGGKACNIVSDHVYIKGETRSYTAEDIKSQWDKIYAVFKEETSKRGAAVSCTCTEDYHFFNIKESASIVSHAKRTADKTFSIQSSFGGSDANIFNSNGIEAVVLGTGQWEPHTHDEYVRIDEMGHSAQWVYDIVRSFSS